MVPLDVPLKRELLTLGEAVWAREGGGRGADGCAASVPAWKRMRRHRGRYVEAYSPSCSPNVSVPYHSRN